MAINKTFYNYGESDNQTPIDAVFLNEIVQTANSNESKINAVENKTQHIVADEASTTFDGTPVYHGTDKEFVVSDDKGVVTNTMGEEVVETPQEVSNEQV